MGCHVSVGQAGGHQRDDLELLRGQFLGRAHVVTLPRLAGRTQLGLARAPPMGPPQAV